MLLSLEDVAFLMAVRSRQVWPEGSCDPVFHVVWTFAKLDVLAYQAA